ncbi:hypothetical protein MmmBen181_0965 [Mycoplasma mycoides subsp. mycoides]|uniref:Uncharacterized protein n=1 Tax=Mycoplasma mycoides subsp. mycoides TaxID=2103 RepID=A0AAE2EII8_MYCMY|nr:hypothetical protein MmmBen_0917 [Mycoplasma mycoides subsp. mycoides]AME12062.1 hypothetical protein MmmBen50_0899 [Mycoplasma mycoides subsp. mycoides]AME13093.1 hypothetical protein MmmBen181_0965 [Mycoplasma mycoides subsp. mycoides]AME14329.1 hypothetical protein MmmBen468_0073 [Mycoplasma mycoides subsp. mycoides]AME15076.1 hypothetical protein MmmBen468_0874 [Mycoplasma mycoides subsp. mycoides]
MRSKIYISMFSCFMLKLGNVGEQADKVLQNLSGTKFVK